MHTNYTTTCHKNNVNINDTRKYGIVTHVTMVLALTMNPSNVYFNCEDINIHVFHNNGHVFRFDHSKMINTIRSEGSSPGQDTVLPPSS